MLLSAKNCKCILAVAAVILPIAVAFALRLNGDSIDLHKWIPKGTKQDQVYSQFVALFGQDDEIMLSWPGCTMEDPRLEELLDRLSTSDSGQKLFRSIASGKTIVDQMADTDFSYPRQELQERLKGVFFARDDDTTAIIIQLSEKGKQNGHQCLEEINRQIEATTGLAVAQAKIGGNVYTNTQIDLATNQSLLYSFPAILLAILITYFCLRCVRLSAAALITAGCAGLLSIALIAICGSDFNGLLVITPVLIMVLVLSATVHLSSYYTRALSSVTDDPVNLMMKWGRRPCLLAVLTTAIGIIMLCTSHVSVVRTFGLYTSLGLILSLSCVLFLFPAIVRLCPGLPHHDPDRCNALHATDQESNSRINTRPKFVPLLAILIVFGSLLALPFFGEGVGRLKTALEPEKMFTKKSAVRQNGKWLADKFSSAECVEVIATFDGGLNQANLVEQIRQLGALQAKLSRLPEVTTSFSIVNVCKMPSGPRTAKSHVRQNLTNEALITDFDRLENRRIAAQTADSISWRIRLHFAPDQHDNLPQFLNRIETKANEVAVSLPAKPDTVVTGIWPLIASGRYQIFTDLARSFLLAFLIITPLIMILVRGVLAGLVAMIPNVLPALAFFGTIGWLGIPVDVGTILTACVGLGIAVDDTLHFLQEYRRNNGVDSEWERYEATMKTIKHCFRPMAYTTLICSGGMLVFVFSHFMPTHNFAIAIVVLLVLALVCDVLVLPALLISPLGRFFRANHKPFAPAAICSDAISANRNRYIQNQI